MSRLAWWAKTNSRSRDIHLAYFLRPKVVLWHECESSEGAQSARIVNIPPGFFTHFTMQRRNRLFARINSTPGKLEFRHRFHLVSQEHRLTADQNRIDTGSSEISLVVANWFAKSRDHVLVQFLSHLY